MKGEELLQQVFLSAVSALFGYWMCILKRNTSKKPLEAKKDAKCFVRPKIIKTNNEFEDVIAGNVINPYEIEVEFDSIGGLENIKQSLHELVILPLCRPELFSYVKFHGPQKVAAVFSLAHKIQPAIIFIDEVDSFLSKRRSTDHAIYTRMKTEFMALWDGFTTDQNARVMVLAATNRPTELDEAILRRFTQTFEVGLPDHRGRVDILKVILQGEKVESLIDIDHIAGLCDGYSGSDLLELCKQAAYSPIRDLAITLLLFSIDVPIYESSVYALFFRNPGHCHETDMEKVISAKRKTKAAASENCSSMYI